MTSPFPVPRDTPAELSRVLAYWDELKRGEAKMPFADDMSVERLEKLSSRFFLLEVMDSPPRFRFADLRPGSGDQLAGRFADEVAPGAPLNFLLSQATATLEAGSPTVWTDDEHGYARLMLPFWGGDRVATILGCIAERR